MFHITLANSFRPSSYLKFEKESSDFTFSSDRWAQTFSLVSNDSSLALFKLRCFHVALHWKLCCTQWMSGKKLLIQLPWLVLLDLNLYHISIHWKSMYYHPQHLKHFESYLTLNWKINWGNPSLPPHRLNTTLSRFVLCSAFEMPLSSFHSIPNQKYFHPHLHTYARTHTHTGTAVIYYSCCGSAITAISSVGDFPAGEFRNQSSEL